MHTYESNRTVSVMRFSNLRNGINRNPTNVIVLTPVLLPSVRPSVSPSALSSSTSRTSITIEVLVVAARPLSVEHRRLYSAVQNHYTCKPVHMQRHRQIGCVVGTIFAGMQVVFALGAGRTRGLNTAIDGPTTMPTSDGCRDDER